MTLTKNQTNSSYQFYKLDWDTAFFGITCAKAKLEKTLSSQEKETLETSIQSYDFVVIENRDLNSGNAEWIGKKTPAFLADVNIQLEKEPTLHEDDLLVETTNNFPYNEKLLDMESFRCSRFFDDQSLAKRGGRQVYREWLKNSFEMESKYFAVSKEGGFVNGYALYSFQESSCVLELFQVSPTVLNKGIGKRLCHAMENDAVRKGYTVLRTGTQVKNANAILVYHKLGFHQVGCHAIYHLWNI